MSWDDELEELHLQALRTRNRRTTLRRMLAAAAGVRQLTPASAPPPPPVEDKAVSWTLPKDVREQMAMLGITDQQVGDVLLHNAETRSDLAPDGCRVLTYSGVAVVVDDAMQEVVAVMIDGPQTLEDVHPHVAAWVRLELARRGLDLRAVRVASPTEVEIVTP